MRCAFVSKNDSTSINLYCRLVNEMPDVEWCFLTSKEQVELVKIGRYDRTFFFRWPHIVPQRIYKDTSCIVFHTSNLPEGRGGSPLQNQIMDGILLSHVNAIKMSDPVDSGDIYLSSPITLQGSVGDIWLAISDIVFDMIGRLVREDIVPNPQQSGTTTYKRRTNNDLSQVLRGSAREVLRFIQMLDGPDYPNAFVDAGDYRLSLSRASMREDGSILCDAVIRRRS